MSVMSAWVTGNGYAASMAAPPAELTPFVPGVQKLLVYAGLCGLCLYVQADASCVVQWVLGSSAHLPEARASF